MKYIKSKSDFIAENKSYQLNEGQFSWMTHDTGDQIGSEKQNTIDVYMYDNEGNKWKETRYDGYGNFGGQDYYDLVATMNGYDADRQKGVDLAFGKLKTKDKKRKTLFPALVTDPRYNWKRHDFTEEADGDPNQSWYQEEEDDRYGYDDYYESVDESTARNVLKDATNALTKTFAGKKLNKNYIKDYLKSIERMARNNPMDFVKDYGEFTNDDWMEDVRYNMANEKVTEAKEMSKKEVRDLKIKINNARTIGKYFTKDEVEFLQSLFESVNEGKGDKAVSMAQKKLDKVMADLKANLLKFKSAKTDADKETFKSEAGRLTKLRKDAHDNLEQAIQDAYADVDLVVMETEEYLTEGNGQTLKEFGDLLAMLKGDTSSIEKSISEMDAKKARTLQKQITTLYNSLFKLDK